MPNYENLTPDPEIFLIFEYSFFVQTPKPFSSNKSSMTLETCCKLKLGQKKKGVLRGTQPNQIFYPKFADPKLFFLHFLRLFITNLLHRVISYDFVNALYCEVVLVSNANVEEIDLKPEIYPRHVIF